MGKRFFSMGERDIDTTGNNGDISFLSTQSCLEHWQHIILLSFPSHLGGLYSEVQYLYFPSGGYHVHRWYTPLFCDYTVVILIHTNKSSWLTS